MNNDSSRASGSGDRAWLGEVKTYVAAAYVRAVRFGDSLELRALIRALTRHLRRQNLPPELALIAIKSLLPPAYGSVPGEPTIDPQRVREAAIRWSIIEYYAQTERTTTDELSAVRASSRATSPSS